MSADSIYRGIAYFAAVKFLGYTVYGHVLRKMFFEEEPDASDGRRAAWFRAFKIGAIRTLIGLLVGAGYAALVRTGIFGDLAAPVFLLGLLPVRIGEWLLLFRIVFKHGVSDWGKTAWAVFVGIIVSYGLDFAGIVAGLALPGGVTWIC